MSDRKPGAAMPSRAAEFPVPVKMESREPHSIRFKPSEWVMFAEAAAGLGLEVTKYVRECALTGHDFSQTMAARKGAVRVTA